MSRLSTWSAGEPGVVRLETVTDSITALALEGECDIATAPDVDEHVGQVLAQGKHLVIDVSGATFIDSSIVRALFAADDLAKARGRVFVMQVDGMARVNRTLALTGADTSLPTAASRAEAIDLVTARAGDPVSR